MKKTLTILLIISCFLILIGNQALAAPASQVEQVQIGGSTANLIKIDPLPNRTGIVALAHDSVHDDQPAADILNKIQANPNQEIVAAINGGFFGSYYEASQPRSYPDNAPLIYSTVIQEGLLVNGLGDANLLGFDWQGRPYIERVGTLARYTINNKTAKSIWGGINKVNPDPGATSLFTPEFTLPLDTPAGSKVYTIKDKQVVAISDGGGTFTVPAASELLLINSGALASLASYNETIQMGDAIKIVYSIERLSREKNVEAWKNMRTAIAGGRILVMDGKNVSENPDYNASFDSEARQGANDVTARSFAAIMPDGQLILGATGAASMKAIGDYLISIGAIDAIALDGGGSTALYHDDGFLFPAGRKLASMLVIVDEVNPQAKVHDRWSPIALDPGDGVPSAWALEYVERSKELELVPEWLQHYYRSNISRYEFAVIIKNLIEKKSDMSIDTFRVSQGHSSIKRDFPDLEETYTWVAGNIAVLGIIQGRDDGSFDPHASITRQEAATILMRTAKVLGASMDGQGMTFTDENIIASWAQEPINYVTSVGIMNGRGEEFDPLSHFHREQAYITIINAFNTIK